jgi:CubicO group peptidase (beta-lactamase class C family)
MTACNYNDTADNSGCAYAEEYYDCDGACLTDIDTDGICDELEILGCMDVIACNYDETATHDEGCVYADEHYDCDGVCISNIDCLDICGGDAVYDACGVCNGDSNFSEKANLCQEWVLAQDLTYFDSQTLNQIITDDVSNLSLIEGLIIIHKGKIVGESYYNGSYMDEVYENFSVTKSYVSTLTGIAIDQGYLDNIETKLSEYFPEYSESICNNSNHDHNPNHDYSHHQLLSMTTGYTDQYFGFWSSQPTSTLLAMSHDDPGSFYYNNSACHLNSHILNKITNMSPFDYGQQNLFPYLGYSENIYWDSGWENINDGSRGLYLTLREMVKLGQLYLQDGWVSDYTQIVSSEWISESTSYQSDFGNGYGYGYLWWLGPNYYRAVGWGSQYIFVFPGLELVLGIHSTVPFNGFDPQYDSALENIIYDQILPLFENND